MPPALLLAALAFLDEPAERPVQLFNGETLAGWAGEPGLWRVEPGAGGEPACIVGSSPGLDHNTFLTTDRAFGDFDLTFECRLTPDAANSGVQFRSERIAEEGEDEAGPDSEIRGYQADMGAGWWGKLYEENLRGMLYGGTPGAPRPDQPTAAAAVRPGAWNTYRVRCEGDRVRTWINGEASADLLDPAGRKTGVVGLQMHSGGPMQVRFRGLELREL